MLCVVAMARAAAAPPEAGPTEDARDDTAAQGGAYVLVEGQVTDAIGGGQKGVTVTVYAVGPEGTRGEAIASGVTNEFGDFRITASQRVEGELIVSLTQPDFGTFTKQVTRSAEQLPPYVAAILKGDLVLRGVVKDALSAKPVGGALVTLESYDEDKHDETDEAGRFEIAGVAPGPGSLVITAAGYGREQRAIRSVDRDETVPIELKPERVVHFTVTDENGTAVERATIEVYDAPRDDFRTAVTDTSGKAIVEGIHADAGVLRIRLSHPEHVTSAGFDRTVELPKAQSTSKHELQLVRAGTVAGRVLDRNTRMPVYAARVVTGDEYSDDAPRAWTDSEGRYAIVGVAPGSTTVTVHRSGFAPKLQTVQVNAGETATANFKLSEPIVLSGSVEDADGKPIANAYVETTRWRGKGTLGLRAMSDAEGRFTIQDAPADELQLTVVAEGFEPFEKTVSAGRGSELKIVLSAAEEEAGKTGPVTGDPAPDITVTTLDGGKLSLAKLKGKTVLLNFWATWCPPCVEEMPELIEIHEKFGGRKDFVMIGLSRDFEEDDLRKFLRQNKKVAWPQVVGRRGGVERACEAFGVSFIPRLFIIGPDGVIRLHHIPRKGDWARQIEAILKQNEGT